MLGGVIPDKVWRLRSWGWLCVGTVVAVCAIGGVGVLGAQVVVAPADQSAASGGSLPQAPEPQGRMPGTISGVVRDVNGDVVPGAHVRLVTGVSADAEAISDGAGQFEFGNIDPGPFTLIMTEEGMQPLTVTGRMRSGEQYEMPAKVAMKIATANQTVEVTVTRQELAEDEIKQQEKQRVAGIVPNFFVSYNWKAVPLTSKQKFELGWHATIDPTHFIFSAIGAGISYADNAYPGYKGGWSRYGKLYGASLADSTTGTLIRGSVMPSIFHQDPRYFYKGRGTISSRFWYALSTAVRSRGDDGHWQISSGILADFASGAISNLYYAPSDRHGAALTFENGALGTVGVGVGHVIQEFVFKHFTPGLVHAKTPQP
jgi:hypothetical protein